MFSMLLKQPPKEDDKDVCAVLYIGQRNKELEDRFKCRIVKLRVTETE